MQLQHVFGPVPSRRLGRSLGVSPIPFKTCNYSCVYCQLGRTSRMSSDRRTFFPPDAILDEIRQAVRAERDIPDHVTFSGDGEPTLCRDLGRLIEGASEAAACPVAVITNGSLLGRADVRADLRRADVVMPSLDAADEATFRLLNRPHRALHVRSIIDGLATFRQQFPGRLWMEIMLVRGVNDREEVLAELRRALDRVMPDRIYLNVPIRPPAESWVRPPDAAGLVRAERILGNVIRIDEPERGDFGGVGEDPSRALLAILRRHPMREEQVLETLRRLPESTLLSTLRDLEQTGRVQHIEHGNHTYFAVADARYGTGRSRPAGSHSLVARAIGHVAEKNRDRPGAELESKESDPESTIVVREELATGLRGLEVGQRILVLYHLDRSVGFDLLQHPRGRRDRPLRGVFALRSPRRPNPIGATTVTVVAIEGNELRVRGLDALPGSPILDLKPASEEPGGQQPRRAR
ncbi:TrmO family methyltransferase [bacterium]|nr:TrmO family methyltransferase [bacterium]